MRELPADHFHAIVTDPPYGIGFMGKEWDTFKPDRVAHMVGACERKGTERTSQRFPEKIAKKRTQGAGVAAARYDESPTGNGKFQAWCTTWAIECLRVARPGAHIAVCGGPRTFHRVAIALEDAGWELRDTLCWLYGSGFPKSLDMGKEMDRLAGESSDRRGLGRKYAGKGNDRGEAFNHAGDAEGVLVTAPASAAARQWDGWGTALKPAREPIILARKPFRGPVATNLKEQEAGALNVKACQLDFAGAEDEAEAKGKNQHSAHDSGPRQNNVFDVDDRPRQDWNPAGRWPPNVALDQAAAELLDSSHETTSTGHHPAQHGRSDLFAGANGGLNGAAGADAKMDAGGPSRFFYVAKASRKEREAGLDGVSPRDHGMSHGAAGAVEAGTDYAAGQGIGLNRVNRVRNHHPTVKPVALMAWLCRLLTAPDGRILDPFAGSGTTGAAAVAGGWAFTGIEIEPEYVELARHRVGSAAPLFSIEEK